MNTHFSEQDLKFKEEVSNFLSSSYSPSLEAKVKHPTTYKEGMIEWQKILYDKGWIAPSWPEKYGGTGWSDTQKFIFQNERASLGIPFENPFGLKMVGPVIYTFGSEDQKKEFLPRILSSEDWWCQGYSEPGAGSDLAALKTKATRDGDDYIVNGAKIWTTNAQLADWIFCLVRTDSEVKKKQEGITFLLIDMKTQGIKVNPIITIDGRHSLNEVEFKDVRVPVSNCVGEENKGWTYAKALLAHERTVIAGIADSKRELALVKAYATEEVLGSKPLMTDPGLQRRILEVETELMALEYTELRILATVSAGGSPAPAESSMLKIKGSEIRQTIQTLMMDVPGLFGAVIESDNGTDLGHHFGNSSRLSYMYGRAGTIYGGSNEVQRNIVSKIAFGL